MESVLEFIFNEWIVGLAVPILIGLGFTLLADEFKEYKAARVCFWVSALWMTGKVLMWAAFSSKSFLVRALVVFVVAGIVAVGLAEAIRLALKRERTANEPVKSSEPIPASVKFTHTSLVFYQHFNSVFVPGRPASMTVVYENTSEATARQVKVGGVLRLIGQEEGRPKQEDEWNDFYTAWVSLLRKTLGIDLDAKKTNYFKIETDPLTEAQVRELQDERAFVHFMGNINWSDDTGNFETNMCSYYRPSVKLDPQKPESVWYECGSGHNEVRKVFTPNALTDAPKRKTSLNIEVLPAVDLGSRLAYHIARMRNTGDLPARKVNRDNSNRLTMARYTIGGLPTLHGTRYVSPVFRLLR